MLIVIIGSLERKEKMHSFWYFTVIWDFQLRKKDLIQKEMHRLKTFQRKFWSEIQYFRNDWLQFMSRHNRCLCTVSVIIALRYIIHENGQTLCTSVPPTNSNSKNGITFPKKRINQGPRKSGFWEIFKFCAFGIFFLNCCSKKE